MAEEMGATGLDNEVSKEYVVLTLSNMQKGEIISQRFLHIELNTNGDVVLEDEEPTRKDGIKNSYVIKRSEIRDVLMKLISNTK